TAGFTASIFVRDIQGALTIRGVATGYTPWTATINADGTIATAPTTGTLTVEKCSSGWFRIGMYDPAATSSYELQMGSGSANAVTIWGGQLESGSVMTSYIPTAGTQVTRSRELFRRDSSAPLLSSSMSVIFVGRKQQGITNVFWTIDDGADSDKVILESDTSGGLIRAKVFSGATEVARVNGPSSNTPSQRFKAAVSYDNVTKRLSLAVNGVIYTASVGSASLSKVLNRISCGCTVGG
ncbi:phage head spike fiber domain-containing protein, partial [Aeromonas caviae]|uniref:phage head spike fiber domain-containing protein n=1 Tax=Aeromonas caviae TaxID=648 RepID=UPI0038CF4B0F